MLPEAGDRRPGRATLAGVVEAIGPTIIDVLAAPAGLDVPVTHVTIHDPVDPPPIEPCDVVLAVATRPDDHAAEELVATAAAAGAAGVVVKIGGQAPPALLTAARRAGIALFGLTREMSWSQLHMLLRTATAATGAMGEDEGAGGAVGDLFGLANAIASMVGGPTTIEDPRSTVLAYSSLDEPIDEPRQETILGRRVPEVWRRRLERDGVFRRLWSDPGVVHIDYPDEDPPLKPRLAIAIRAGDEVLGSIWVAEGDRPLGPGSERALTEAARLAALHLIRSRFDDDLERERRAATFRAVLEGRSAPELLAGALGVDERRFATVIAFELGDGDPDELAVRARRVAGLVGLYCESLRRKSAAAALGRVVYLLVADDAEPDRGRLATLASDVIERVRGPARGELTAAVGTTMAGLQHILVSRQAADQVLRVLSGTGRQVAAVEEVRSETILLALREYARRDPQLLEGKLGALVEHDRTRRSAFVETLRAYLDAFGDIPSAAAATGVHPNTFRYRLRRLSSLADLRLDDPVERLVTELQLHIGDLDEGGA